MTHKQKIALITFAGIMLLAGTGTLFVTHSLTVASSITLCLLIIPLYSFVVTNIPANKGNNGSLNPNSQAEENNPAPVELIKKVFGINDFFLSVTRFLTKIELARLSGANRELFSLIVRKEEWYKFHISSITYPPTVTLSCNGHTRMEQHIVSFNGKPAEQHPMFKNKYIERMTELRGVHEKMIPPACERIRTFPNGVMVSQDQKNTYISAPSLFGASSRFPTVPFEGIMVDLDDCYTQSAPGNTDHPKHPTDFILIGNAKNSDNKNGLFIYSSYFNSYRPGQETIIESVGKGYFFEDRHLVDVCKTSAIFRPITDQESYTPRIPSFIILNEEDIPSLYFISVKDGKQPTLKKLHIEDAAANNTSFTKLISNEITLRGSNIDTIMVQTQCELGIKRTYMITEKEDAIENGGRTTIAEPFRLVEIQDLREFTILALKSRILDHEVVHYIHVKNKKEKHNIMKWNTTANVFEFLFSRCESITFNATRENPHMNHNEGHDQIYIKTHEPTQSYNIDMHGVPEPYALKNIRSMHHIFQDDYSNVHGQQVNQAYLTFAITEENKLYYRGFDSHGNLNLGAIDQTTLQEIPLEYKVESLVINGSSDYQAPRTVHYDVVNTEGKSQSHPYNIIVKTRDPDNKTRYFEAGRHMIFQPQENQTSTKNPCISKHFHLLDEKITEIQHTPGGDDYLFAEYARYCGHRGPSQPNHHMLVIRKHKNHSVYNVLTSCRTLFDENLREMMPDGDPTGAKTSLSGSFGYTLPSR